MRSLIINQDTMRNVGPTAVDHTGFTVASLDDAIRFWTDALGFELLRQGEIAGAFIVETTCVDAPTLRAALVEAPNGSRIELVEYAADKSRGLAPASLGAIGAAHVAITVGNIEQAVARIEAEGWTAKGLIRSVPSGARQGTKVAYVSGPDGIIVELLQAPT